MSTAAPANSPADIEQQLDDVRKLLERNQFAHALRAAESIVSATPQSRDALHLVAVCQRHLQSPREALATLATLEALSPNHGRLFQERGHCQQMLGDAAAAIAAYERAVTLNTALPAS